MSPVMQGTSYPRNGALVDHFLGTKSGLVGVFASGLEGSKLCRFYAMANVLLRRRRGCVGVCRDGFDRDRGGRGVWR
jgi:hypothetical protein